MLLAWWMTDAHAADASPAGSLSTVLVLLAVVGSAYLLTHFVVERAQQRFLFVSGLEYVVLGVLLGPHALPQIQPFADLTRLAPVFAFAAGWVGLLYGLDARSAPVEARPLRIAVLDAVVTGVVVTAAAHWWFQAGLVAPPAPPREAWSTAILLGCAAAAGSSSAVELLQSRYGQLATRLLPLLKRTSRFGDLVAIGAFGLVFCWFHQGTTLTAEPVGPREWFVLTVGLGVVLGWLFAMFLGDDRSENSVFLAMVGTLLLASGAAFFLNLSAVFVNLVLGLVLAQTRFGDQLRTQLEQTAKPARLVLLLFAGSQWRPVPLVPAALVVLGFLGLRMLAKVVASAVGTAGTPLRADLFRGLIAQGDVAVAMALSFRLVYDGPTVDLAYTAVLVSVAVSELIGPRMLRGLLVDAGELGQDLGPVPSASPASIAATAPAAPERS
ncbi:MAG: hypothetical protein ABMB14_24365 [Myxococcota bacterium]